MFKSVGVLLLAAACVGAAAQEDPYLWLEEVAAPRSLEWVAAHNAASTGELGQLSGFASLRADLTRVLDARERIPYVFGMGGKLYNFWKDAGHPRGVLRRTTLAQYRRAEPAWETVLDVDALAAREGENWVWHGIDCLEPDATRCLVSLTRGGGDSHVVREFDMRRRAWVADGFALPEAKGEVGWIDRDRVFVATDFGPGSLTVSGYPRIVKEWRRGTPLAQAATVFEGRPEDTSVDGWRDHATGSGREFVIRRTSFFTNELFLRARGRLQRIDKPLDADAYPVRDQLLMELRSAWTIGGKTYPAGALIAIDCAAFLRGARDFSILFEPTPTRSLQSVTVLRHGLLLSELDNVRARVEELTRRAGRWERRQVSVPEFGTVGIAAVDARRSDQYFMTVTDFLTPTTLYLGAKDSDARQAVKALPAFFDAAGLRVEQLHATARDGTRIPYFVVMRTDARFDGSNPTLLYGYGGFELTQRPGYSAVLGKAWLEKGGVYVLANIRGGGEFGPGWHQAALKERRQVSYDDFLAVAQDLQARAITAPRHLGIMGGSLGGMLVSVAMLQRPDLFNAVVSQVPLTDMRRYHKLLAGASWIDEYGDPDVPEQWAYIAKYSPYQNARKEAHYPDVFYTSSTRDDRVHPAHARKMVARLEEQGHKVLYWENTDGGHGGAVNASQQAQLYAMIYSFLWSRLR